jgi:hypothetical protein
LLAILGFVQFRDTYDARWLLAACAAYLVAALTQEIALAFPLVPVALAIRDRDRATGLPTAVAFGVTLVVYLALRSNAIDGTAGVQLTSGAAWMNAGCFLTLSIKSLVFPFPQHFYVWEPPADLVGPVDGGIALAGAIACAMAWRRAGPKNATPRAAVLWALAALLPTLGGALHVRPQFGMRSLYPASVAVAWMVGWASLRLIERRAAILPWLMIGATCVLVPLTWFSSQVWRDGETLLAHSLTLHPTSDGGFSALGDHFRRKGDTDAAIEAFSEAVRHANSPGARAQHLYQLGTIHGKAGRVEESMAAFSEVLELDPGRSSAMLGMGNNEWARGEMTSAADWYKRALAADPTHYEAAMNLAMALEKLGDYEGAVHYRSLAGSLRTGMPPPER